MAGLRAGPGIRVDRVPEYVGKECWAQTEYGGMRNKGLIRGVRRKGDGSTYGVGSRRLIETCYFCILLTQNQVTKSATRIILVFCSPRANRCQECDGKGDALLEAMFSHV